MKLHVRQNSASLRLSASVRMWSIASGGRFGLATAPHLTAEQRARMARDPDPSIAGAAADAGIRWARYWERPDPRETEPALTAEEAGVLARSTAAYERRHAADAPNLPADLVAGLARDPEHAVRLAVSMREELTEAERAAIDYTVGPDDRIQPVPWAVSTRDPSAQAGAARSAHAGLRRSVTYNRRLAPDLVTGLAGDDDFVVRLLLCEHQPEVPGEVMLATYLDSRVVSRGDMLFHPSFPRVGLARYADDPDPRRRALVAQDPTAPPDLIAHLSHDEHPTVRSWMAADARLPTARVLELLDDEPWVAEAAAGNPALPPEAMERILAEAAHIEDPDLGEQVVYLGRRPHR